MTQTASSSATGPFDFAIGDELRGERATLGKSLLDVQRDLRIKAAYISAIEDTDAAVFPDPSFIPGYVRSYARYLGLDAEAVYARFCAESGFEARAAVPAQAKGASRASLAQARAAQAKGRAGTFRPDFPMARPGLVSGARAPASAIGSLVVLAALAGGLGYGGWTILQNIQRVQFAPVEETPVALAAVEALAAPETPALAEPALSELARPVAATALTELYRQQEVEVPILVRRDGPIAAIDPERVGLLAVRQGGASRPPAALGPVETPAGAPPPLAAAGAPLEAPLSAEPSVTDPSPAPSLVIVAERAAWIRVYLADKTVLFERILETGETYSPPADVAALIWAGNSGSVYVRLGEHLHGPLGSGTRAVRDVALDPTAIAAQFPQVEDVPEAISAGLDAAGAATALALR